MSWNQIAKGWKQVVVTVVSPQKAASEADRTRSPSSRADAFYSARYEEATLPPYVPDGHRERSDFSPHLSC
jgi:hypothetical protein